MWYWESQPLPFVFALLIAAAFLPKCAAERQARRLLVKPADPCQTAPPCPAGRQFKARVSTRVRLHVMAAQWPACSHPLACLPACLPSCSCLS